MDKSKIQREANGVDVQISEENFITLFKAPKKRLSRACFVVKQKTKQSVLGRCLPAGNILACRFFDKPCLFIFKNAGLFLFRINNNLVFAFLNLEVTNVVIHYYLVAELGCVVTGSVQYTHD